jgi:hypothetical protein
VRQWVVVGECAYGVVDISITDITNITDVTRFHTIHIRPYLVSSSPQLERREHLPEELPVHAFSASGYFQEQELSSWHY